MGYLEKQPGGYTGYDPILGKTKIDGLYGINNQYNLAANFGPGRPQWVPYGQINFDIPGTWSWIVPDNVFYISALVIGGGGGGHLYSSYSTGGGGGALAWANNIPVTPGNSYTVVVGAGGNRASSSTSATVATAGGYSYLNGTNIDLIAWGGGPGFYSGGALSTTNAGGTYSVSGTYSSSGGGNGGQGGFGGSYAGGGGGAGGYAGAGGSGYVTNATTNSGSANSGTGGAAGGGGSGGSGRTSAGGGGVGIYGQGSSGTGGTGSATAPTGGGGGSNGQSGLDSSAMTSFYSYQQIAPNGGLYGGGGGGSDNTVLFTPGNGARGIVRIIWGQNRFYPSTNTFNY